MLSKSDHIGLPKKRLSCTPFVGSYCDAILEVNLRSWCIPFPARSERNRYLKVRGYFFIGLSGVTMLITFIRVLIILPISMHEPSSRLVAH